LSRPTPGLLAHRLSLALAEGGRLTLAAAKQGLQLGHFGLKFLDGGVKLLDDRFQLRASLAAVGLWVLVRQGERSGC
jgi:hypothetical protein